jgi:hypothetical protein
MTLKSTRIEPSTHPVRPSPSRAAKMTGTLSSTWSILFFLVMLYVAPAVGQSCFSDFNAIYDAERAVTNTNLKRVYTICPNKLYHVGYLDFNNNLRPRQKGGPPLPLRPNMRIQCGADGSRDNLCWIIEGHLQVDGTSIRGLDDVHLSNVEIVGFVFIGSVQHSTWITKPGSITFKDCEWRVRVCRDVVKKYLISILSPSILFTFILGTYAIKRSYHARLS